MLGSSSVVVALNLMLIDPSRTHRLEQSDSASDSGKEDGPSFAKHPSIDLPVGNSRCFFIVDRLQ